MVDIDIWWLIPVSLSLITGIICPITGSLLITQKRTIQANLIAHSVLPGLVLALAIGIDPTIGGLLFGLIGALVAEKLNQDFSGRESASMNTVLAGFTALGVLLVPLLKVPIDLESVLFGDILTADLSDMFRTLFASAVILIWVCCRHNDLVFLGVDPEGAIAAKRPVREIRFFTTLITTIVIISSITAVGVVLVIGMLCAPVLIHIDRSESLKSLVLRSAATGFFLNLIGMLLAVLFDLPPGPLIGVLCVFLLLIKKA